MSLARHLDLLGPQRCVGCGARSGWLCERCAKALPAAREEIRVPGIEDAFAAWAYEGAARHLVLALKLRSARDAAGPLVDALTKACRIGCTRAEVVTWVPARRRDLRKRGFDHARVIAEGVASGLGLPARSLIVRSARAVDQAGLGRAQRIANQRGTFTAPRRCPGAVLLVDDLVTTGATAASCATALRASGASRIELAVACRT